MNIITIQQIVNNSRTLNERDERKKLITANKINRPRNVRQETHNSPHVCSIQSNVFLYESNTNKGQKHSLYNLFVL
jgi:hypothetical protein